MGLVGLSEIAKLAGVSRQAVQNWRTRDEQFPRPLVTLGSGPVWDDAPVRRWLELRTPSGPPDQPPVRHRDPHMNVFWSCGNAALENNLTRALIVTLRTCGPAVTARFLERFVGAAASRGAEGQAVLESFQFALQSQHARLPIEVRGAFLLTLTAEDEPRFASPARLARCEEWSPERRAAEAIRIDSFLAGGEESLKLDGTVSRGEAELIRARLRELERGSRPDAWIVREPAPVVTIVESKLGGLLDRAQLARHSQEHLRLQLAETHRHSSWRKVGLFFAEVAGDQGDGPGAFLAGELVEYLDLLGYLPWRGFRDHHFELDQRGYALGELVALLRADPRLRLANFEEERDEDWTIRFPGGDERGNVGVATWRGDSLFGKLVVGARSYRETTRLLAARSHADWRGRVVEVLESSGVAFHAVVKVRFKAASSMKHLSVTKSVPLTSRSLDGVMDSLASLQPEALPREEVVRRHRASVELHEGVDLRSYLSSHPRFHVSGELLVTTEIPRARLVAWTAEETTREAARDILALEALRAALFGAAR